jgi:hypothetical protein
MSNLRYTGRHVYLVSPSLSIRKSDDCRAKSMNNIFYNSTNTIFFETEFKNVLIQRYYR